VATRSTDRLVGSSGPPGQRPRQRIGARDRSSREALTRGVRGSATCALLLATVVLLGCAPPPTVPHVMAMPGHGKSPQQFDADDASCRSWAESRTGISPGQAAADSTASSAALGTLLGGAAGAALGAAQEPGHRRSRRRGRRSPRRHERRRRVWPAGCLVSAARLRRGICAMHVRERQPGTERNAAGAPPAAVLLRAAARVRSTAVLRSSAVLRSTAAVRSTLAAPARMVVKASSRRARNVNGRPPRTASRVARARRDHLRLARDRWLVLRADLSCHVSELARLYAPRRFASR
jgi:hypothetical protein